MKIPCDGNKCGNTVKKVTLLVLKEMDIKIIRILNKLTKFKEKI